MYWQAANINQQVAQILRRKIRPARLALLELGSEYDKTGQNAEAIAIYREFPTNEAAAKRLIQLQLESGNATAAIPGLEAAVKRSPTTPSWPPPRRNA